MSDSGLSPAPAINADQGRSMIQIRDNGYFADVDGSFQPTLAHLFSPRRLHFTPGGSTGIVTHDVRVQFSRLTDEGKLLFLSSFVPQVVETLRSHDFEVE